MEKTTLLNVLSPQLQALVEASLGEKLQVRQPPASAATIPAQAQKSAQVIEKDAESAPDTTVRPSASPRSATCTGESTTPARPRGLNPSELFVLRHPESPGFVVRHDFLGTETARRAREALVKLATQAAFHQAGVGHGQNLRQEETVRGDRIHWLQRPADLRSGGSSEWDPALLALLRKVEGLVFGIKKAIPELDLRNITSTQLAIFPGNGSRFVKHTDTYSTAHVSGRSDGGSASETLVRRITCVYYLNDAWVPEHGGGLRLFVKGSSPPQHWDIPPMLDTLAVFRSTDVEHEVLPTFHERMALTIWYYGPPPPPATPTPAPARVVHSATAGSKRVVTSLSAETATIFVAIPSYRDSECRRTVDDLLAKAQRPDRISIGICLQVDDADDTEQYLLRKYPCGNVRITKMHYSEAAGPCVARAVAQSLWAGEAYYLQIDSHMRVREAWDEFLIDQLEQCDSPKPILTTYPLGYTLPNEISNDRRPTLLCASGFDGNGMLRQSSKTLSRASERPLPSLFWAAGFAFSSSSVIREVPYDDSLRHVFFGEESSMSARLWTHGWDFFAPSETIIYHLWSRAHRPVFQELETSETRQQRLAAQEKIRSFLQERAPARPVNMGMGSARTLAAYQQHIGVDFTAKHIEWRAEWGGLEPIQFDISKSVLAAQ